MNVANMDRLIETLEGLDEHHFTMAEVGFPDLRHCGTAGCIWGWGRALMHDELRECVHLGQFADWLGIPQEVADELCVPNEPGVAVFDAEEMEEDEYISLARALAQVKRVRNTGMVNWEATP